MTAEIKNKDKLTFLTVKKIKEIVKETIKNKTFIDWVYQTFKGKQYLLFKNPVVFVKHIFDYLVENIDYTLDAFNPYNQNGSDEVLITPLKLIEFKKGDCDDFVMLAASILYIHGFPLYLRVVRVNKDEEFAHIYLMVRITQHGFSNWWVFDAGTEYPVFNPIDFYDVYERKDFKL